MIALWQLSYQHTFLIFLKIDIFVYWFLMIEKKQAASSIHYAIVLSENLKCNDALQSDKPIEMIAIKYYQE